MARYPSNVGRAPVDILRLVIKHVFKRGGSKKHVSTHRMQHALRGEGTQPSGQAPTRALALPGQAEHHQPTEPEQQQPAQPLSQDLCGSSSYWGLPV